MTAGPNCPIADDPTLPVVPEHEAHRQGKAPKARASLRLADATTRRFRAVGPVGIPGINLTNYGLNATQKGWGNPCTQARTTITLSNGVRLTVASRIALLSTVVLNECIKRGYRIRQADTGAYNCRYISGTRIWSNHAWAIAIDLNWQSNPFTSARVTDKPAWLFALFNRYGFANGADYTGAHDWMHHEFMGTPAQADQATALAVRELTGSGATGGSSAGGGGGGTTGYPAFLWGAIVDAAPGSRTIGLGSRGPNDVKFVQRWHGLTDDGEFGTGTYDKVRATQKRNGLLDDGVVGPATWKVILGK